MVFVTYSGIFICADLEFKCHEEEQSLINLLYQRNKKVPPGKKYKTLIMVNSKMFLVVLPRFWVVQALERLPTWKFDL